MKQRRYAKYWILVIALLGNRTVFAEPFAKGPYLGQIPPGSTPQVFAPGLISDTRPHQGEGWVSFSADGNTFCFYRDFYVYITENTDQGWTRPEQIKSVPYMVTSPCLSPDANSIFFVITGNRPRILPYGLFRCDRTTHGWSEPQRLGPPLSSSVRETSCSIAANNNFYLCSNRKGWDGKSGIWVVPFVDNAWPRADSITLDLQQPLIKYGPGLGGRIAATDPGIAPDESFMVFTDKDLPGGFGHRDLYLTLRLPDGTWSTPRNLGPNINSAYIEHGPRISPDKKYLFFNRCNDWDPRTYSVCSDIYWVELKEYLPESHR